MGWGRSGPFLGVLGGVGVGVGVGSGRGASVREKNITKLGLLPERCPEELIEKAC